MSLVEITSPLSFIQNFYWVFATWSLGLTLVGCVILSYELFYKEKDEPRSVLKFGIFCLSSLLGLLGYLTTAAIYLRRRSSLIFVSITLTCWIVAFYFHALYVSSISDQSIKNYEANYFLSEEYREGYEGSMFLMQWDIVINRTVRMLLEENWEDTISVLSRLEEAAELPDLTRAVVYNNLGVALLGLEKHNKALASFNKAIELAPKLFEPLYNRSFAEYALLDFDASKETRQKAVFERAPSELAKIDFGEPLPAVIPPEVVVKRLFSEGNPLSPGAFEKRIFYERLDAGLFPVEKAWPIFIALFVSIVTLAFADSGTGVRLLILFGAGFLVCAISGIFVGAPVWVIALNVVLSSIFSGVYVARHR